jgi:hypothetical protein
MTERPSNTNAYGPGDRVKTPWTFGRAVRNAVGETAWRFRKVKISTMAKTVLGVMVSGILLTAMMKVMMTVGFSAFALGALTLFAGVVVVLSLAMLIVAASGEFDHD